MLSIAQAAKIIRVSTKTLRRWESQGILVPIRSVGNQRRYSDEQITSFTKPSRVSLSPLTSPFHPDGQPLDLVALINSPDSKSALRLLPPQRKILISAVIVLVVAISAFGLTRSGITKVIGNATARLGNKAAVAQNNLPATVLASETAADDYLFNIAIKSLFKDDVTIEGQLTAPNIVYSLTAGTNVSITGDPQTPTISVEVEDPTADLDIFKTIAVGSTTFDAGGIEDTLTFASGSNVSLSLDTTNKKLTISSTDTDSTGGWTDNGTNITLTSLTDTVTIGSTLIISDAGLIDLSAVLHDDSAAQGFKLPQAATLTNVSSGEGFLAYDSDDNLVKVFDGSAWANISGASTTLQNSYDNDTNGSDTIITLTTSDDSLIFRNPATSGTDSAFNLQVDNLATGLTTANFKNLYITNAGTLNTTSASLTNYSGYFSNTSSESAGSNTLTNVGLYATASGADANYAAIFDAGNVGIGTTTPAFKLDVTGTVSGTTSALASFTPTLTSTNTLQNGLIIDATASPASAASEGYIALTSVMGSASTNIATEGLVGLYSEAIYTGSGTVASLKGIATDAYLTGSGTITNAYGIYVDSTGNDGAGTITNNYGIFVGGQNAGTNDYGIAIFSADTQALWIGQGGAFTTAAQGIAWGSGRDVNLYRSAADTLKTDDNLTVALDVTISGGDIISTSTTFSLINTTATTLNLGGAATTLNIAPTGSGASSVVLSGGSADTGCTLDGSTGNFTCSGSVTGSSGAFASTLQNAYDNDANGSDTTIALTANDDSLVFSNPTSSGTDSDFILHINQQNTTDTLSALDITQASNAFDAINITANSIDTENVIDISATGLTTGNGINVALTEATLNGGFYFRAFDNTAAAAVFSVGEDGNTTITGLEGSTMLTLTAGDAAISDGSLSITDDDNAASFALTNNTVTTIGASDYTTGLLDVDSTSLTTGAMLNLNTSAVTTGRLLNAYSTSTALTTGSLGIFNWEPSAVATASGDLFRINIGAAGDTTGNLFNITDAGSSLFSVSTTTVTSALPVAFNAPGDVSAAYDLVFTNQTASYIKSNAPLYLEAGESFENNNLNLKTFGTGDVVFDFGAGGAITIDAATTDNTSTTGVIDLNVDAGVAGNIGLNIDYISRTVAAASDVFAAKINLDQQDADGDLFGLQIALAANSTTLSGTNYVDCLLCLTNAENTAAAVLSAITIDSTAATAGSITNGLFINTTDVTTDIRLQNGDTIDNDSALALVISDTVLVLVGGSASDLAFALDGDIDTGMYGVANTSLRLVIGGTEEFTLTATNLEVNGTMTIDLGTTSDEALCGEDGDDDVSDVTIRDCSAAPVADYAEIYPTANDIEYGDVVVTGSKIVYTKGLDAYQNVDSNAPLEPIVELIKSNVPYQNNIIGITSNNYGDFSSIGNNRVDPADHPLPVALSGRVLVKVSSTSDPIQPGDFVTTSTESGKAMKATRPGFMVGKALESWSPGSGQDRVLVYTNYNWGDPNQSLAFDDNGNLTISGNITAANLNLPSDLTALLADIDSQYTALVAEVSGLEATVGSLQQQIATISDQLANLQIQNDPGASMSASLWGLATDSGRLTTIYEIQSSGATFAGAVHVGLLTLDDIAASLSSATGVVTISGDLAVTGTLQVLGDSAGKVVIPAGETEIVILSSAADIYSKFFATPEESPIAVAAQSTQSGELVLRIAEAQYDDLTVNWWIID